MAGCMKRLRKWLDRVPDWLWPHLTGDPIASPSGQREVGTLEEATLAAAERAVEQRLGRVDERLRAVESKLVAMLTLTSILSAAVTAGFAAVSTLRPQAGSARIPLAVGLLLATYTIVNLLLSVWSTVSGLMRRGFGEISYGDLAPREEESEIEYRTRILNRHLNHAEWNDWVLDQKVSELAVAHVALRNALSATGGLIIVGLVVALLRLL